MPRVLLLTSLLLAVTALLPAPSALAVGPLSLVVDDPGPTTADNPPIVFVDLHLDLDNVSGVGSPEITVVDPEGSSLDLVDGSDTFFDTDGNGSQGPDEDGVTLEQASVSLGGTPVLEHRYTLRLLLDSNYDDNFENIQSGSETFTISSANADFEIRGACALSFYFDGATFPLVTDVLDTPPAAIEEGGTTFAEACQTYRPDLDVVLVLDRSGSMSGPSGTPKVQVLRDAVVDFTELWEDLRAAEGVGHADRLGVVLFDGNADWWADLPACGDPLDATTCLHDFASVAGDVVASAPSLPASGVTSIGDGVGLAFEAHDPAAASPGGARKVILLLSDGMQNTTDCIAVDDDGTAPDGVFTHPCNDAATRDYLGSEDAYQIYAATLGPAAVVDASINMALAGATGGFYASTESDYQLLRPFFLELLQNFLQFNSHQTIAFASAETDPGSPRRFEIPVTATSNAISFSILWNEASGGLRATITPPSGSPIELQELDGDIRWTSTLPREEPGDHIGNWIVEVAPAFIIEGTTRGTVPFKLHGVTHDVGVRTAFAITPADYVPGAPLHFEARLQEHGDALTGLPDAQDDVVLVRVAEPGVALGDLLSDSTASTAPPAAAGGDSLTAAEAKLLNELEANPDALDYGVTEVRLFDDGAAEHGDAVAGDGVYSALHTADLVGHYNALFVVEGDSRRAGRFRREQLQTAYVRAAADPGQTEVAQSVQQTAGGPVLNVQITPRTIRGNRIGPLYQNYLWVKAPQGAFAAADQLDGTYRAAIPFSGDVPEVSVHFVPPTVVLRGDPTEDQLPVPLDEDTRIGGAAPAAGSRWSLSAHLGFNEPGSALPDRGPSGGVDVEYALGSRLAVELFLGYDEFDGGGAAPDVEIKHLAADLRWYFTSGGVRPFVLGGLGLYDPDPGSTELGGLLGGGVQWPLSPDVGLEVEARYHDLFGGPDYRWLAVHAGLRLHL